MHYSYLIIETTSRTRIAAFSYPYKRVLIFFILSDRFSSACYNVSNSEDRSRSSLKIRLRPFCSKRARKRLNNNNTLLLSSSSSSSSPSSRPFSSGAKCRPPSAAVSFNVCRDYLWRRFFWRERQLPKRIIWHSRRRGIAIMYVPRGSLPYFNFNFFFSAKTAHPFRVYTTPRLKRIPPAGQLDRLMTRGANNNR